MAKLNSKTDKTKKIIHLLVTPLCTRNCPLCCNKQYDMTEIPIVTEEELRDAEILCLTGGEPFVFSEPLAIGKYYKTNYPNIKKVYVYTNAYEFSIYLGDYDKQLDNIIDGVNVSIKNNKDLLFFNKFLIHDSRVTKMTNNRLYVFNKLVPEELGNFKLINRVWQEDFQPADDSIFRRI